MEPQPEIAAGLVAPIAENAAETILLVEDEAFVRKVTAEVLESGGYTVLVARKSDEALELYGKCPRPVDLLLADIILPGMSGPELASKLERTCPCTRILLMSGHAGRVARLEEAGYAGHCLVKPFSASLLLKKVREVLSAGTGRCLA